MIFFGFANFYIVLYCVCSFLFYFGGLYCIEIVVRDVFAPLRNSYMVFAFFFIGSAKPFSKEVLATLRLGVSVAEQICRCLLCGWILFGVW